MSNEIMDSFVKNLGKRLTTPIYGTFLVSWSVFHWKFFVILLFVSEDKIWQKTGLLKQDYLYSVLCNYRDPYFYISWILPFVVTWLVIWKFSKWISLPAFKKEEEYRAEKKIIRIKEQKRIEVEEINLEKESVKRLDVVSEKTKKQNEIIQIDPKVGWEEEYEQFTRSHLFKDFNKIIESIYVQSGYVSTEYFEIPKEILAFSHSNGLVEFSDYNKIELTDKGKFFVKNASLLESFKVREEKPF